MNNKWNQTITIQRDFEGKQLETVVTQVTSITKSGWGYYRGYAQIDGNLPIAVYSTNGCEWFADLF